jgi:hypothetical protein
MRFKSIKKMRRQSNNIEPQKVNRMNIKCAPRRHLIISFRNGKMMMDVVCVCLEWFLCSFPSLLIGSINGTCRRKSNITRCKRLTRTKR